MDAYVYGYVALAVAEFGCAVKFACGRFAGNEVHMPRLKRKGEELFMLALLNNKQIALHVLAYYEPAFAGAIAAPAYAKAAALTKGVIHKPVMPSYYPAVQRNGIARLCRQIFHKEFFEIALAYEAYARGVLLFCVGQLRFFGYAPKLGL